MRPRFLANRLVGSLVLALSLGCGEQNVVVAYLGSVDAGSGRDASAVEGSAGQDGPSGESDAGQDGALLEVDAGSHGCSAASDCPSQQFCVKSSCNVSFGGHCQSRPPLCGNERNPVCGCDGVIYWNDCLRQQSGVAASTMGACPQHFQVPCDGQGNPPCPIINGSCAKLATGSSGSCDPDLPGACWVLPATCPEGGDAGAWFRCGGGPESCTDLCDAIKSGEPYQSSNNTCL
jgi:hypothetical protein